MESLKFILSKLKEAKLGLEGHVVRGGSIGDFAQYRFLIGQIKGFEDSIGIIEQFIKEANNYE